MAKTNKDIQLQARIESVLKTMNKPEYTDLDKIKVIVGFGVSLRTAREKLKVWKMLNE